LGGGGITINIASWADGGAGLRTTSKNLAGVVTQLCTRLAEGGSGWGWDDLGQAFISGGAGRPGFGTTLADVMGQAADMVNALAYGGAAAEGSGLIFAKNEVGVGNSAGVLLNTTPAAGGLPAEPGETSGQELSGWSEKWLQNVEKVIGASGLQLAPPYVLPPYTGGPGASDQPPANWMQIVSLLEELTPYKVPDGSKEELQQISSALSTAATAVTGVAENVKSVASRLLSYNSGGAAVNFGAFAADLVQALDWLSDAYSGLGDSVQNLLLLKETAWDQLGQAVAYLSKADANLTRANMSAAESDLYTLVRDEGQTLVAARKSLDDEVLAGLPTSSFSFSVSVQQLQKAVAALNGDASALRKALAAFNN
jgi:hypothetical protein